jgi:hypothetical protein
MILSLKTGLARCENVTGENPKADIRVGAYVQEVQAAGDEELVCFFGTNDSRTTKDRKRMKMSRNFCIWWPEGSVAAKI